MCVLFVCLLSACVCILCVLFVVFADDEGAGLHHQPHELGAGEGELGQ